MELERSCEAMSLVREAARILLENLKVPPEFVSRAPGRVNIIGEHTDYNDGFVMPVATNLATYTAVAVRPDRTVRVFSAAFDEGVKFSLDDLRPREGHWSTYLRGVAWSLQEDGVELRGVDAAIVSNVPLESGVSSSAALEVSWAMALLAAAGHHGMDRRRLALVCQRAENDFVGMNCGIMDQMASLLGEEDSAVLLDCRSLQHQLVPLPAGRLAVVIMDTGKPRALVDSEYNLRRAQCEEAARTLGVEALRDASIAMLDEARHKLSDVVFARARHVITENQRVIDAAEALRNGHLARVGELLNESHASLAFDYEVSCPELDLICEIARRQEGCWGARLVGAGFGGCAMALVTPETVPQFVRQVKNDYDQGSGYSCRIFTVRASRGATVEPV
jgi:galactokinase